MVAAASGFALGFSLILAIGAQNAFVLRQGIIGRYVLPVVIVCAVSDALLIAAGVAGIGLLADKAPAVVPILRYGGAAFLFVYGALRFRAAWRGGAHLDPAMAVAGGLGGVLATCLALTWLNPHVYLDTVVLIGSVSSRHPGEEWSFALGAMAASVVFFTALGYGARLLAPLFRREGAWRVLEIGVGVLLWSLAAGLLTGT